MVCVIKVLEEPRLREPVLIEGLPGIGFVANIAAMHMIRELKARKFAVITSSSFQDFAMTVEGGGIRTPINELYECAGRFIILYGNTQAGNNLGQYELCWRVLELAKKYGCRFVLTMGGYGRNEV
ncbi:MAG TPA: proteasome assembly chaperone family protein, partial [Candidatus Bathyarchaeota archaeon]|nr:proteasome assembly chaperone family protein [Candidatus Bathyarchaeota archaeon]